jgi:tRNA wybutosine-synthesizing protein 3
MDKFDQRKQDILSKKDKSSKGNWDKRIISLCDRLNSMDNYYSTSSCSGRIIVMRDEEKKGPGLFEFVSHDLVDFDKFWDEISLILDTSQISETRPTLPNSKEISKISYKGNNLKFKQESVILHIACRELSDAKKLLDKGLKAGFKKSGIISLGKNIIVELNLSEKLEFPLVENGSLLVGEEFLKKVLERANNNLEKGWKKIRDLELGLGD